MPFYIAYSLQRKGPGIDYVLLNNYDKPDQLRSLYQTPLFPSVRNKVVTKEAFEDLQGGERKH